MLACSSQALEPISKQRTTLLQMCSAVTQRKGDAFLYRRVGLPGGLDNMQPRAAIDPIPTPICDEHDEGCTHEATTRGLLPRDNHTHVGPSTVLAAADYVIGGRGRGLHLTTPNRCTNHNMETWASEQASPARAQEPLQRVAAAAATASAAAQRLWCWGSRPPMPPAPAPAAELQQGRRLKWRQTLPVRQARRACCGCPPAGP
jgi:hypothetical protein